MVGTNTVPTLRLQLVGWAEVRSPSISSAQPDLDDCAEGGYLAGAPSPRRTDSQMNMPSILQGWPLEAVLAIVAGVVILLVPRVLNYVVAVYLLVIGALGLLQARYGHTVSPQAVIAIVAGVLILIKPAILNYVVGIYLIVFGLLEAGIVRLW